MANQWGCDYTSCLDLIKTNRYVQAGLLVAGVGVAAGGFLMRPYVKLAWSAFTGAITKIFYKPREELLLQYVKENAKKGDPESVLATIDKFCWDGRWMMHIGNEKGKILDAEILKAKPKVRECWIHDIMAETRTEGL